MMTNDSKLSRFLEPYRRVTTNIYAAPNDNGYWSNLSRQQNAELMTMLGTRPTRECIAATQPSLAEIIFSPKRAAALELLRLNGTELAVDLGCMWGALTIPLAKQVGCVLGVDQTIESLRLSEARVQEEELENVTFLCADLRKLALPTETFDVAIVNGVLEWIPELEPIVVADYLYGRTSRRAAGNPGEMQLAFLENIYSGLKQGGRAMVAIENRYDYKMFFGQKDPHTNTWFTTILPRWLANIVSKLTKERGYRPWIYSFRGLEDMLKTAGFGSVELYACWPDYRMPAQIQPYGVGNDDFQPVSSRRANGKRGFKRSVANRLEWILFKKLDLHFFAPSIIAIAEK